MKVLIVGAGIMGLATAWGLGRKGHQVSVYEQGPIPNPLASSVDRHRVIRQTYGDMEGYARMAGEAYAAWELLWGDLGERLQAETGVLAIDGPGGGWARASADVLERLGAPYRMLDRSEVARAYPLLEADDVEAALCCDGGGVLQAGRIVELLAHHLVGRGVRLHPHRHVRRVDPERGRLALADGAEEAGDAVVVAAGPWVGRLLPDLAARVTPSRQITIYIRPPEAAARGWAAMPVVVDIQRDGGIYIVPPTGGVGIKVGDHTFSRTGQPDEAREAGQAEAAALYEQCRRRLKDFDRYGLESARTCFYTVEAQERFVVERLGAAGWVMTGFSGHGFKFGAAMGLAMAEAVTGARSGEEVRRWAAGH